MRPADGVHVEWVEDEAVVLHPETGELHYLNPQAALILALIEEEGYEAALVSLKKRFPDASTLDDDVAAAVDDMVSRGILVDG